MVDTVVSNRVLPAFKRFSKRAWIRLRECKQIDVGITPFLIDGIKWLIQHTYVYFTASSKGEHLRFVGNLIHWLEIVSVREKGPSMECSVSAQCTPVDFKAKIHHDAEFC